MTFNDPLYVQVSGVEYSAAEDRKMFGLYTPGVISSTDFIISAGTGLQASVSAGKAIVDDGSGGGFLVSTSSANTRSLSANTTNTIYLVVDPDASSNNVSLETGSVPTDPYLVLGTATTNGTVVTSVNNTRNLSENAAAVGRYLKAGTPGSGDISTTGNIIATGYLKGNSVVAGPGVRFSYSASSPVFSVYSELVRHREATYLTTVNSWYRIPFDFDYVLYNGNGSFSVYDSSWNESSNYFSIQKGGMYLVTAHLVLNEDATPPARPRMEMNLVTTSGAGLGSVPFLPTASSLFYAANMAIAVPLGSGQGIAIEARRTSAGSSVPVVGSGTFSITLLAV